MIRGAKEKLNRRKGILGKKVNLQKYWERKVAIPKIAKEYGLSEREEIEVKESIRNKKEIKRLDEARNVR